MKITDHPSYIYARSVVDDKVNAPKYVKLQCRQYIDICEGKIPKYTVNMKKVEQIDYLLHYMIMPTGIMAGKSIYEATVGYQWLLFVATLAVVHAKNKSLRRYQKVILEICRKNFKTFSIAILFILLSFTEPRFSKLFSVAPDGTLSRELRTAIDQIIRSSIYLGGSAEAGIKSKFKILRDYIMCIPTQNKYTPLNYSTNRLDGREPSVFLIDEVGALPTSYAIEAMESGQLLLPNRLGFVISTKYPKSDNPFESEVDLAKKALDGTYEDETLFALLYEPDNTTDWMTDDGILQQANPAAIEIPAIMAELKKKRAKAIESPASRENFVTKHCNIIYQGVGTESFLDVADVRKCRADTVDFTGLNVYVGVDLSMTTDNTAVTLLAYDGSDILCLSHSFIPEDKVLEKSTSEKFDYAESIERGECSACGGRVIDYSVVEDWVNTIEERFSCTVASIGFDRYNCMSSAQKWESAGFTTVEIKQHSSVLHPAIKLIEERILDGKFRYAANTQLETNFENARCRYDTNKNKYIDKKRSNGKVDMLAAMINAAYLLNLGEILSDDDFVFQVL